MGGEQKQVFAGTHLVNVRLTGPSSEKITRHHEIAIDDPAVNYLPGDALGAQAQNAPALVECLLRRIHATGDEVVAVAGGPSLPLHRALTEVYNLDNPSRRLLELCIARGAGHLGRLLEREHAEAFKRYLTGWNEAHDVLDVLNEHPGVHVTPQELADALRKSLPRLYSVASSLKTHPNQVHLLVVSVRYDIRGRERVGICSTWLADRWPLRTTAEVYLQNQQKHFAMPADPETRMIMVGPGTGLAPFRAFIEERRTLGARGKNWLFFGEQRRASEFFYEQELTEYARDGFLRLDVAFSRDQAEKIYVQHRMREHERDIWAWLEAGAEVFVCGDKERMAADVDRELHHIVEVVGGRTPEEAHAYIEHLRAAKRYKRDVY